MKNISLILLILVVSVTGSLSQDKTLRGDLEKINAHYNQIKRMSMRMEYRVYTNWNSTVPVQTENGELKKKDQATYTKIGKIESLNTLNYNVIVDHEIKSIAIMPVIRSHASGGNAEAVTPDFSKVLDLCKAIELDDINDNQKRYTLIMPEGAFEYGKLEITYNSKSYFIDKLVMYYREAQNLEGDNEGVKETPRIEHLASKSFRSQVGMFRSAV